MKALEGRDALMNVLCGIITALADGEVVRPLVRITMSEEHPLNEIPSGIPPQTTVTIQYTRLARPCHESVESLKLQLDSVTSQLNSIKKLLKDEQ